MFFCSGDDSWMKEGLKYVSLSHNDKNNNKDKNNNNESDNNSDNNSDNKALQSLKQ